MGDQGDTGNVGEIKETIKETTSGLFPASCSLSPIDLEVILLQLFSKQFLDFLPFL